MKDGYLLYLTEEEASWLGNVLAGDIVQSERDAAYQERLLAKLRDEAPSVGAAIDRIAGFTSGTGPFGHMHPENLRGHAGRVLDAAFLPTEEGGISPAGNPRYGGSDGD